MKKYPWIFSVIIFAFIFPIFCFGMVFCVQKNNTQIADLSYGASFDSPRSVSEEEVNDIQGLKSAIEKIDTSSQEEPLKLNFNLNIEANFESEFGKSFIELNSGYLILTGKITTSNEESIFKLFPSNTAHNFTFENLELKNTSSNNENLTAILIEQDGSNYCNINLGDGLKSNYAYLFNYVNGANISFNATDPSSFEDTLYFAYSYKSGSSRVLQNVDSQTREQILPKSLNETLYDVSYDFNANNMVVDSLIKVKLENNIENYETPTQDINLDFGQTYSLPTSESYSFAHHDFVGWMLEVKFGGDETTYYVECSEESVNALELGNKEELKTSLTDTKIPFTQFSTSKTNLLKRAIISLLDKEIQPKFALAWKDTEYTISFDDGDGVYKTITGNYGDEIELDTPTKAGYIFVEWKISGTDEKFDKSQFDNNYELVASWTKEKYQIVFVLDFEDLSKNTEPVDIEFGDEIIFPSNLTKTGYNFGNEWYSDENFLIPFDDVTMPAGLVENGETLTLYAKWIIQKYNIYLMNGKDDLQTLSFDYNTHITQNMLPTYSKTGYSFDGWFFERELENKFSEIYISSNLVLYLKFKVNTHKITYYLGYGEPIVKIFDYNSFITYPQVSRDDFKLNGWKLYSNTDEEFNSILMPDYDISAYASWTEKTKVLIDKTTQKFTVGGTGSEFNNFSDLQGFVVEYLVDGNWQTQTPEKIGTYDVRISRAADDTYASVNEILKDAFVIEPIYLNLNWLVAILFIIFVVEIVVCILLSFMKKFKKNLSFGIAALPILSTFFKSKTLDYFIDETRAITGGQFTLLIIGGVLAVAGFVAMIVMIVRLHRTLSPLDYRYVHSGNNDLEPVDVEHTILKVHNEKQSKEDEKIKNKVDDYLNKFVTNKNGYVENNENVSYNGNSGLYEEPNDIVEQNVYEPSEFEKSEQPFADDLETENKPDLDDDDSENN